jgi:hypothetical protein
MRMGLCSTVVPGYDATGGLIVRVFSEGTAARVRSAPTDSFPILSHFPITVLCPGEQINVFQLLFEAPTTDARYRPDGGGLVCICSPHQTNPPPPCVGPVDTSPQTSTNKRWHISNCKYLKFSALLT